MENTADGVPAGGGCSRSRAGTGVPYGVRVVPLTRYGDGLAASSAAQSGPASIERSRGPPTLMRCSTPVAGAAGTAPR